MTLFGRIYGGIIGGARSIEIGAATNTLAVIIPMTNLFNTGLDDNHKPIAYGATDPHWRLLPGSPDTNPPVVTYTGSGWMYSNTNSAWLTPSTLISPGGVSTYRYQTWFWLQPWEAASAVIRGQWSAALQGTDILINGLSTGQATVTDIPSVPYQNSYPFRINRGFCRRIKQPHLRGVQQHQCRHRATGGVCRWHRADQRHLHRGLGRRWFP